MKEQFFNKKVDNFEEYEYPFLKIFLKDIFGDKIKRKYSLIGEGIFILLYIDEKIYEFKFKEAKTLLLNDGRKAFRDETKDRVIAKIANKLDENEIKYTINSGKFISFKLGNYIAKVEIIKKLKEPEGLGKTLINGEWV